MSSEHTAHSSNPHQAHHWTTMDQQVEAGKFGMWLFLAQEVLFFSALFLSLTIYRGLYPDMYRAASRLLNVPMGAFNTVVLICSSLTMALAVRTVQLNNNRKAFWLLLVTFCLAATFLVVKYFEYAHKFEMGELPGKYFTNKEIPYDNAHVFFGIYFFLTGLHGIHVIVGMGVIFWLMVRTWKNEFSSQYYTPVECVGLYWHLVDLIWIFLFPLLYLVG
jgi:cytochrome c oxidase subunit 3